MSPKIEQILISQPKPVSGSSPYFGIAEKFGVIMNFQQLIKVVPVSLPEYRRYRIDITAHTAIVFTSRVAIDHFFGIMKEVRIEIPETMKYFCKNEAVANYLQKYTVYRKRKVFINSKASEAGIIESIKKHPKENYFVPIAEKQHNHDLIDFMTEANIKHTQAVMYRTVSAEVDKNELLKNDMMIFFTPAGIDSLKENLPNFQQGEIKICTYGKHTTKAAEEAGLRIDLAVTQSSGPGSSITAELERYLEEQNNA